MVLTRRGPNTLSSLVATTEHRAKAAGFGNI
jgi:hypothetical protein